MEKAELEKIKINHAPIHPIFKEEETIHSREGTETPPSLQPEGFQRGRCWNRGSREPSRRFQHNEPQILIAC